jgi:hypothetical protein
MDDLLTPLERATKDYLMRTVSADLMEALAVMAVERPADPHLFLATRLLAASPALVRHSVVQVPPVAAAHGGGTSPSKTTSSTAQARAVIKIPHGGAGATASSASPLAAGGGRTG